jgi:hypothetical protein
VPRSGYVCQWLYWRLRSVREWSVNRLRLILQPPTSFPSLQRLDTRNRHLMRRSFALLTTDCLAPMGTGPTRDQEPKRGAMLRSG